MALAKRFLLISVLLFGASYAHATACSGSATCVQYKSTMGVAGGGTFNQTSTALAFDTNNTVGNTLIAVIGLINGGSASTATVADSQGNVWAVAGCENNIDTGALYYGSCIAYAPNCKAGANTVTVTQVGYTGNYGQIFTITEYAGLLTSVPFDSLQFVGNPSSPSAAVAVNTNGSSELLITYGFSEYNNTGTWGVTSGFNLVNSINGSSYFQLGMWEEAAVAAGNWSNTVASSGTNRGLHAGIAAFRPSIPTVGHVQGNSSNIHSTSIAVTLPFNVSSGDLLVASINATAPTGTVSISGCSGTWYKAAGLNGAGGIWYAMNNSAGACTATITTGNNVVMAMTLDEYQGVSHTFALENYVYVAGTSSPVNMTLPTSGTSDLIYSAVAAVTVNYSGAAVGTLMTPSAGYGQRLQTFFGGADPGIAVFDTTAAAGSQTNNVTVTNMQGGTNVGGTTIAFRSAIPNPGSVQWTACTVALTVSTTCVFTLPPAAGDMVIATIYGTQDVDIPVSGDECIPVLTDSNSDVFGVAPITFVGNPPGGTSVYYGLNVGGGSGSQTITSSAYSGTCNLSSGQDYDIILTEVHGLASTSPVKNATYGGISSTTSVASGSLVLPTGTYYLYSTTGDVNTNTYTESSGFITYPLAFSPYFLRRFSDKVVTAGTYSDTVSSSGSMSSGWVGLVAFSPTAVTDARVVQVANGGGAGSQQGTDRQITVPVQAGNRILAFAQLQVHGCTDITGVPVISDDITNSYTLLKGGTTTDNYGLWVATNATTGTRTVSITCTSVSNGMVSLNLKEIAGVSGSPIYNAAENSSSSSLADGGISTTVANSLVESFGGSSTGSSCSGNPPFPASSASGYFVRNYSGSHCASTNGTEFLATSTGSQTNTYTTGSNTQLTAAIIAFAPTGAASATQPSVQIITKLENKDELWKAFWGEGQ